MFPDGGQSGLSLSVCPALGPVTDRADRGQGHMLNERTRRSTTARTLFRQGLGALALSLGPLSATAMPCTNMTLVLAIDGSGSISDAEFALQIAATARAITNPEVIRAMAEIGGVAVNAVIWADTAFGVRPLDWVRISDSASAAQFAAMLARQPRNVTGNTDMGNGINGALDLIDDPNNCASYNVIDVSGDGRETLYSSRRGASLLVARHRAEDLGVIINGLAISTLDSHLAAYYRDHVISGPAAFVIETTSFEGFGEAMQRKLLKEIGGYSATLSAEWFPAASELLPFVTPPILPKG
jgi:hypothetical protein